MPFPLDGIDIGATLLVPFEFVVLDWVVLLVSVLVDDWVEHSAELEEIMPMAAFFSAAVFGTIQVDGRKRDILWTVADGVKINQ